MKVEREKTLQYTHARRDNNLWLMPWKATAIKERITREKDVPFTYAERHWYVAFPCDSFIWKSSELFWRRFDLEFELFQIHSSSEKFRRLQYISLTDIYVTRKAWKARQRNLCTQVKRARVIIWALCIFEPSCFLPFTYQHNPEHICIKKRNFAALCGSPHFSFPICNPFPNDPKHHLCADRKQRHRT